MNGMGGRRINYDQNYLINNVLLEYVYNCGDIDIWASLVSSIRSWWRAKKKEIEIKSITVTAEY